MPSVREVIDAVMKQDSSSVLKCLSISNSTVQRHIDEMALDVEKTPISELRGCKFAIQPDESTFSTNNILMAYVRYRNAGIKCNVDEFLFAKYFRFDPNGETIYRTLQEYFKYHDIPLTNITTVACDGAPARIGRYRGFSDFLMEIVPEGIHGYHCVIHRQHLVSKKP